MTTGERLEASEDLWAAYRAEPTEALRHQLVLQYSPLVKYVAGRVRVHLPATVESADLVSEGVIGLMDAIEKFEPDRGWEFQTYAVPRGVRAARAPEARTAPSGRRATAETPATTEREEKN